MPLWIGLGAAGAGLIKAETVDVPKAQRQRALAAATQRYSPWTGLKANQVQEADPFGSALQYGATGATMGANYQNMQNQNKLMDSMSQYYGQGGAGSAANMTEPASTAATDPSLGVNYQGQFQYDPSNPWARPDGMGYYGR